LVNPFVWKTTNWKTHPKPTHTRTGFFFRLAKLRKIPPHPRGFDLGQECIEAGHIYLLAICEVLVPEGRYPLYLGGFKINNKINM